jgi:Concanavalin A-like lectin/glucanases superfamily
MNNQRLYLNGARVAQMSDTLPIDLNSASLGIGRHVSGIADPFNGHIDEFRIADVQRSDGWIETTWNNMSDPGAFAVAGAEEQKGGEPPPLAGAGVVICLMGDEGKGWCRPGFGRPSTGSWTIYKWGWQFPQQRGARRGLRAVLRRIRRSLIRPTCIPRQGPECRRLRRRAGGQRPSRVQGLPKDGIGPLEQLQR